ncbi:AcrR family transcriptional regulator [Desulfitispora alkaliphila]
MNEHSFTNSQRFEVNTLTIGKKETIVLATIELLAEKPLHLIKASEIAGKAQIAVGTIYIYFDSLEELNREVVAQINEAYMEAIFLGIRSSNTYKDNLKLLQKNILNIMSDRIKIYRARKLCAASIDDRINKELLLHIGNKIYKRYLDIFIWAQATGELDNRYDPEILMISLWGSLEVILQRHMIEEDLQVSTKLLNKLFEEWCK